MVLYRCAHLFTDSLSGFTYYMTCIHDKLGIQLDSVRVAQVHPNIHHLIILQNVLFLTSLKLTSIVFDAFPLVNYTKICGLHLRVN